MIEFIKEEKIFTGTASELAESVKSIARPNILAKKLMQNKTVLAELGITVEATRTRDRREILLRYIPPPGDSCDGNDNKTGSSAVANLSSQPSLLSQTER